MVIREAGGPHVLTLEELPILAGIARLVDAGLLTPKVSHRLALEQVAEGHRQVETGRTIGKVVISVRA